MTLSEDKSSATYQIQSIQPGKIIINNEIYTHSVIISAEKLIAPWRPKNCADLTKTDLLQLLEFNPEIILIGTGKSSTILNAQQLAPLLEKQFHVECMSTQAACRTYTVLIAEGRKVVAGLIV